MCNNTGLFLLHGWHLVLLSPASRLWFSKRLSRRHRHISGVLRLGFADSTNFRSKWRLFWTRIRCCFHVMGVVMLYWVIWSCRKALRCFGVITDVVSAGSSWNLPQTHVSHERLDPGGQGIVFNIPQFTSWWSVSLLFLKRRVCVRRVCCRF